LLLGWKVSLTETGACGLLLNAEGAIGIFYKVERGFIYPCLIEPKKWSCSGYCEVVDPVLLKRKALSIALAWIELVTIRYGAIRDAFAGMELHWFGAVLKPDGPPSSARCTELHQQEAVQRERPRCIFRNADRRVAIYQADVRPFSHQLIRARFTGCHAASRRHEQPQGAPEILHWSSDASVCATLKGRAIQLR